MAQFEYGDQVLRVDDATNNVLVGLTNRLYDVETALVKQKAGELLNQAKARRL